MFEQTLNTAAITMRGMPKSPEGTKHISPGRSPGIKMSPKTKSPERAKQKGA